MDTAIALVALTLLGIVVGAILGAVAFANQGTLRRAVRRLEEEREGLRGALDALRREVDAMRSGQPVPPTARAEPQDASVREPAAPEPEAGEEAGPAAPDTPSEPAAPPSAEENETAAAPAAGPPPPRRSLEEALGTRWAVWIGGLALALGGLFLVRYSIEQGLLGPGVRVILSLAFGLALLGAGEWARRTERLGAIASLPAAHIPGTLTAAGTVAVFGSLYAAHALYGFIGPAFAFILLGAVALLTMVGAALHGPALAALGILGAFTTPALVSSDAPNALALVLYLLVVTAGALVLARIRMWKWLAVAGVSGALIWGLLYYVSGLDRFVVEQALYVAGLLVLFAATLLWGLHAAPPRPRDEPHDWLALGALAGTATLTMLLLLASDYHGAAVIAMWLVCAGLAAIAWRWPAAMPAAPLSGLLFVLAYLAWRMDVPLDRGIESIVADDEVARQFRSPELKEFLSVGFIGSALYLVGSTAMAKRAALQAPLNAVVWGGVAGAVPLLALIVAYARVAWFEQSLPYAGMAVGLAVVLALAAEILWRREGVLPDPRAPATAALSVGAIGALCLAIGIGLDQGWLTIALALMMAGIAMVEYKRPVPALRTLTLMIGLGVAARILWDVRIFAYDPGTTPIFNWLLIGYGVPALSAATAAYLFKQREDDVFARALEALALLFAVILAFFEIRHFMNDGDILTQRFTLAEQSLMTLAGLAIAAGLLRVEARTPSPVLRTGSLLIGAAGLAAAALGHLLALNPMVTGKPVGEGPIGNDLLLGYLIPALALMAFAAYARGKRPDWYVRAAAVLSCLMMFAYVSLTVRHGFHGSELAFGETGDAELYTYSAVWLVLGVALLALGIVSRSVMIRLASAVLMLVTVSKVFLYDMSALTGLWRALSFIGLGVILIGIGALYQRLLFQPPVPEQEPEPEER